jgi:prephenate dehydratase
VRLAFQGEPGAYSDEAASEAFPSSTTEGFRTFRLVFEAVAGQAADAAMLPVENSLAGVVQEVNDLLWEVDGLRIGGEHVHPVRHCLLAMRPGRVDRVISHPQALAQCRLYLESNGIEAVPFYDTAGAARHVALEGEPGLGAIASAAAAERYGLGVIAAGIQDDRSNRTRFAVVERGRPCRPQAAETGWKGSLAFMAAHQPGSLVAALGSFSRRGLNLTRLDSRPLQDQPFHYRFYLDFEVGDPASAEAALAELEETAAEVRLFGTYPAAGVDG